MTDALNANDAMTVLQHRHFIVMVQNSLFQKAERYRKEAERMGSPALLERAAIFQELYDTLQVHKP